MSTRAPACSGESHPSLASSDELVEVQTTWLIDPYFPAVPLEVAVDEVGPSGRTHRHTVQTYYLADGAHLLMDHERMGRH